MNLPRQRRIRRVTIPVVGVTALATALLGCGSSSSGSGGASSGGGIPAGPIHVAEFVSETGADSALGFEAKIFDQVNQIFNANGGIDGHKVVATVFDDKSDPATGLSEAESVVSKSEYSAVTWTSSGNPTQTITLEVMKGKLPNIEYEYPDYLLGKSYPYYWTTAPVSSMQATTMTNYDKKEGLSDVGVLSDGSPFGTAFADSYIKDLDGAGISNKLYTYSPTSVDVSATLKKMQAAGVKVVSPVGELDLNGVFSGLQELGWYPKVVGSQVVTGYYSSKLPKQVLDNTVTPCQDYATTATAASYKVPPIESKLLNLTAGLIGRGPGNIDTIADYDSLLILKAAILKANSTNRVDIDKAMTNLTGVKSVVPGVTYSFANGNHVGWLPSNEGMCGLSKFVQPYDLPIALPGYGS